MFGESFITILFRLLNFAALIALFAYIFKKYMRHDIEQAIEHHRLEETNITNQIEENTLHGSKLSEEIRQQENLCQHLIARANQWKLAFGQEQQKKQLEIHAIQQKCLERIQRQARAIERERIIQAVLPKAVEKAQAQLMQSFTQENKNRQFIDDIIAHMKKGI